MTIQHVGCELSFLAGAQCKWGGRFGRGGRWGGLQYKGTLPLISVMPTCLKMSHLLPRADTIGWWPIQRAGGGLHGHRRA